MIKCIEFCEVWFLPESVARVAAIVGDYRCHTPGHYSKRLWMCSWGQSLSNHGPHVFYRRKIRRASLSGKQFNLVIDEEPLDHVWSCIILLKYGCGQALKVRKDNWLQHLGDVVLAV
ncbi:uncharacterized protein TNCV_3057341 [Trichonephila clavipes]|nr:uncharacterized protein TNCV_3057341 [Trichonephila clavipes]